MVLLVSSLKINWYSCSLKYVMLGDFRLVKKRIKLHRYCNKRSSLFSQVKLCHKKSYNCLKLKLLWLIKIKAKSALLHQSQSLNRCLSHPTPLPYIGSHRCVWLAACGEIVRLCFDSFDDRLRSKLSIRHCTMEQYIFKCTNSRLVLCNY